MRPRSRTIHWSCIVTIRAQVRLKAILLHHVVPGEVTGAQAAKLTSAKTVNSADIKIMAMNGKIMINDAHVTARDVKASNGVIHVIDRVLLPPARK